MKGSNKNNSVYHTDDIDTILDFINEFPIENKETLLQSLENNLEKEGEGELIGFLTEYDNGEKEYCLIVKDRVNGNKPVLFTCFNKELMNKFISQLTNDDVNFNEIYGQGEEG